MPEEIKPTQTSNYQFYFAKAFFCVWVGFIFITNHDFLYDAFSPGIATRIASQGYINLQNFSVFLGAITVLALFNSSRSVQKFLASKDTNFKIAVLVIAVIPAAFLQSILSLIYGPVMLILGFFPSLLLGVGILLLFQAYRFFMKAVQAKKEIIKQ